MKKTKKLISIILTCVLCVSLCACGSNSTTNEPKTPEDQVRNAVEIKGSLQYMGSTIGDNELKSSKATITNLEEISEDEYRVNGRMVYTDVYGDNWENTFDCTVNKGNSDEWDVGTFEYRNEKWRKQ